MKEGVLELFGVFSLYENTHTLTCLYLYFLIIIIFLCWVTDDECIQELFATFSHRYHL